MKFKIEEINHHEPHHVPAPAPHHMHAMTEHPPAHPIHHRTKCSIIFDEEDWKLLSDIFGDVDTASAVCRIMMQSHPEIQLMFYLQLRLWNEIHPTEKKAEDNNS